MELRQELDRLLEDFIAHGPAGASLQVFQHDEPVYSRCIGYANVEKRQPFALDTICCLASMTKIIASAAVLQLYEQGRLLLTDPVAKYLPEFKDHKVFRLDPRGNILEEPARNEMTLAHLFDMTSGITINWHEKNLNSQILSDQSDALDREGRYTLREFARICGTTPSAFEAGEHFYYGQSLDVLAAVLEVITGQRFGTYLKEHIFDPLGMKDTFFVVPENKKDRLATLYRLEDEQRIPLEWPPLFTTTTYESACGGLYSTTADYASFAQALTLGQYRGVSILHPRTIRMMATNRLKGAALEEFSGPYHSGYGYGLAVRTRMNSSEGSITSPGEFGWTGGFGSWVLMDPATQITILYMHQSIPNREEYIHPRIRNIVYAHLG